MMIMRMAGFFDPHSGQTRRALLDAHHDRAPLEPAHDDATQEPDLADPCARREASSTAQRGTRAQATTQQSVRPDPG